MRPGLQLVAAGDRAAAAARAARCLRPLAAYPPREVPSSALWAGAARNSVALVLAIAFTLIGVGFGVMAFVDLQPDRMPVWVPVVFLVAAAALWMAGLTTVRRARRLLEGGMPARARISRVGVNLLMSSNGRRRTTVEYEWTFAGQSRHARGRGLVARRDRALVRGEELELLCDPSAPEDHLIPLFYGFRLEPF
jgi:hypothetical protein